MLAVDLELGLVGLVAKQSELVESGLQAGFAERVSNRLRGSARGRRSRLPDADLDTEGLDEIHGG